DACAPHPGLRPPLPASRGEGPGSVGAHSVRPPFYRAAFRRSLTNTSAKSGAYGASILYPPVTSTVPFGSSVAVGQSRSLAIDTVSANVSVFGSQRNSGARP